MLKLLLNVFVFFVIITGCTDAEFSKYTTLGTSAEIICKSGGKISFHGISTGKVLNERNSDGYFAVWKIISAPDYISFNSGDIRPATLSSDCNVIYITEEKTKNEE